jgi:hypothetical protein
MNGKINTNSTSLCSGGIGLTEKIIIIIIILTPNGFLPGGNLKTRQKLHIYSYESGNMSQDRETLHTVGCP